MSEIRVKPLIDVTPKYLHDCSRYPDLIRIPMSDGKVITYHIDVDLPHPCCIAINEGMERMEGYAKGKLSHPLPV